MSARDVEPTRARRCGGRHARLRPASPEGAQGRARPVQRRPRRCSRRRPRITERVAPVARPAARPTPARRSVSGSMTAVLARAELARAWDGVGVECRRSEAPAAIVLLSDGKQTQGAISPRRQRVGAVRPGFRSIRSHSGRRAASSATGRSRATSHRTPPPMRAIAKASGGTTAAARDNRQLETFYRRVGSSFGSASRTRDLASWFAAAAALLLRRRRRARTGVRQRAQPSSGH